MPVKKYGIFTAYHPATDLRHEGLGRYLAAFVKAGVSGSQIHFVIACPSWSRVAISNLLDEAGVSRDGYHFLGPSRQPLLFAAYELLRRKAIRKSKLRFSTLTARFLKLAARHFSWLGTQLVGARSFFVLIPIAAYAAVLALVAVPLAGAAIVAEALVRLGRRVYRRSYRLARRVAAGGLSRVRLVSGLSGPGTLMPSLFHAMHQREVEIIAGLVRDDADVSAWYCPAPIWPVFNEVAVPSLVCVPDIVFAEFPVPFAEQGGPALMTTYQNIKRSLETGRHFVTYSEHVKWSVLVDRFGVDPRKISTIRHAPNKLEHRIDISGFPNVDRTSIEYCKVLLLGAIDKAVGYNLKDFQNKDFKYIFYASQFRPSKNVYALLAAYRSLVKERYVGHKLLLTGDPSAARDIAEFIANNNLRNDVLCLHGLSESELAACYKLADLAVNPSLSEGGMPFTFTEALSVGTPVVMGDIAVTREIIIDQALRDATLFDPYDWRAVADKIEWALQNKNALYQQQRHFYDEVLSKRTWDDVVAEHIAIMDDVALNSSSQVSA